MSGYGITANYKAGMLFADYKLWREDAFCHQLSMNGSLLLSHNHDVLWHKMICQVLGWPEVSEWDRIRSVLRAMPAWQARRALWRASYLWFGIQLQWYMETAKTAALAGELELWTHTTQAQTMLKKLEVRAAQLDDLDWCLQRIAGDEKSIEVIALPPVRRVRHPALPAARHPDAKPISEKEADRLN